MNASISPTLDPGGRRAHLFRQVDVFPGASLGGNPVAVVHDADDLDEATMARFARWTNLSETTFLLRPTVPGADWRLRIFTPGGELPFAGHPTLGSAHAWLEAGGRPADPGRLVQECGAGLVELRREGDRLAFAAPPLVRSGPVSAADLAPVVEALGLDPARVREAAWVDNGPGWMGLLLDAPESVLGLHPDFARLRVNTGVIARYPDPSAVSADAEARAFCPLESVPEDPVTGSLNAGFAQWLAGRVLPDAYTVSQGTALGRVGRVFVSKDASDRCWIAGEARTVVAGEVRLIAAR